MEIVGERFDKTFVVHNDYVYTRSRAKANGTVYYKCRHRVCQGSLKRRGDEFVRMGEHSLHPIEIEIMFVAKLQIINRCKELAANTQRHHSLREIFNKVCEEFPRAAKTISFSEIERSMSRARRISTMQNFNVLEDERELMKFVDIIKDYPIVIDRNNSPKAKEAKLKAYEEIILKLDEEYTVDQLRTKISFLKNEVRRVLHSKDPIGKLKPWMMELTKMFSADDAAIIFIPALEAENSNPKPTLTLVLDESSQTENILNSCEQSQTIYENCSIVDVVDINKSSGSTSPSPLKRTTIKKEHFIMAKRRKTGAEILEAYETEETRALTTSQLERLVLLEQLDLTRKKKDRLFQNVFVIENPETSN